MQNGAVSRGGQGTGAGSPAHVRAAVFPAVVVGGEGGREEPFQQVWDSCGNGEK